MKGLTYYVPESISEACSVLANYAGSARAFAGGTDLVPRMKDGVIQLSALVNLKNIGLSGIQDKGDSISIGALTTLSEIIDSPIIAKRLPLLKEAAAQVASVSIRNLATLGGNICNASPSADTVPALLVLGAKAKITGPSGDWDLPLEEFFTGPGQTVLAPGDLLTGVEVPNSPVSSTTVYIKQGVRRAMEIAIVGVAVAITLDSSGVCQACRIALGAVAPTPIRIRKAEEILLKQKITEELIHEASVMAVNEAKPITDIRSSAEYRSRMIGVQVRRALRKVVKEASN